MLQCLKQRQNSGDEDEAMAATQFQQFMQTFERILQPRGISFNEVLKNQTISFEVFNEESESFSTYKQRLENFLSIKQLTGDSNAERDARKKILLNCIGSKHHQLLCGLTTPLLPTESRCKI